MIDPAGFSSQLVAATRAGLDSNIAAQSSKASAKIREFTLLDKNVASLSTTLDDLLKNNDLRATETSLSKDDIIKASTSDGAAVGDYSVEVSQLAKPDRWGMTFSDEKWVAPKDGTLKLSSRINEIDSALVGLSVLSSNFFRKLLSKFVL